MDKLKWFQTDSQVHQAFVGNAVYQVIEKSDGTGADCEAWLVTPQSTVTLGQGRGSDCIRICQEHFETSQPCPQS